MTISIRLEDFQERELRSLLETQDISLSDFVRQAIAEKMAREKELLTPYELGKDLFGRFDSGNPDLSRNAEKILREKIREKHNRR